MNEQPNGSYRDGSPATHFESKRVAGDPSLYDPKQKAREEALAKRNAIPREIRQQKSSQICDELAKELALLLAGSASAPQGISVAVYQPMKSEVDIRQFIDYAYSRGASVCFPCVATTFDLWSTNEEPPNDKERYKEMVFLDVDKQSYRDGSASFFNNPIKTYAIESPELKPFPLVTPEAISFMVVPLVAFDAHNNRLGYGGGNYDQYLPRLDENAASTPHPTVIGVAFKEQQLDSIPTEPHDKQLPELIIA